jgi:hypothetical protein
MSCRFHKTEVRMSEFETRDFNEYESSYETSPKPFYAFGCSHGVCESTCVM